MTFRYDRLPDTMWPAFCRAAIRIRGGQSLLQKGLASRNASLLGNRWPISFSIGLKLAGLKKRIFTVVEIIRKSRIVFGTFL
jgi:hypothetical protein